MTPAHQRFGADHRTRQQRDLWLVEELDFSRIEGLTHLFAKRAARDRRRLHRALEEAEAGALAAFGRPQRQLGRRHEVLGRGRVIRRHRRTDRRADDERVAVDLERLGQRDLDVAGALACLERVVRRKHDGKRPPLPAREL